MFSLLFFSFSSGCGCPHKFSTSWLRAFQRGLERQQPRQQNLFYAYDLGHWLTLPHRSEKRGREAKSDSFPPRGHPA